jgi:hypothetical protein
MPFEFFPIAFDADRNLCYSIQCYSMSEVLLVCISSTLIRLTCMGQLDHQTWRHLALVMDDVTNTVRFYIDGDFRAPHYIPYHLLSCFDFA